ncbi:MAG: DUF2934 domain-containing protein [Acidobacteria bacterium]|nr:DUF2934 domain-containing protein [Acidobacteriota bacterium]
MPEGSGTAVARALETVIEETATQPTQEEIAVLAHALWTARGCPEGTPEVDWFQAEDQLRTQTR